jgi:hypothetical protein
MVQDRMKQITIVLLLSMYAHVFVCSNQRKQIGAAKEFGETKYLGMSRDVLPVGPSEVAQIFRLQKRDKLRMFELKTVRSLLNKRNHCGALSAREKYCLEEELIRHALGQRLARHEFALEVARTYELFDKTAAETSQKQKTTETLKVHFTLSTKFSKKISRLKVLPACEKSKIERLVSEYFAQNAQSSDDHAESYNVLKEAVLNVVNAHIPSALYVDYFIDRFYDQLNVMV